MGLGNHGGRREKDYKKIRGVVGREPDDQLDGAALWVVESQRKELREAKQRAKD